MRPARQTLRQAGLNKKNNLRKRKAKTMRKILFSIIVVALLACPATAQRYRQFQLAIVDEFGEAVTNIDTVEIYDAGTSTTSTIYSTRAGTARTNPMTTTSGGFTQALGLVQWYQAAADFKVTVTESGASQSLTVDNLTSRNTRFAWFVNYIGEAATLQITDDTTLDIGTGDDFYHDWDNSNSRYIIYPTSDGSGTLHFGKAAVHHDIYWHTGAAITDHYVFFDEGSGNVTWKNVDLIIDSDAIQYFGDSSDMSINYDESNNDLDILSTTALDEISFGATGDGYDLKWWGTTGGDYVLFTYSSDEVVFVDIDLQLQEGADLEFYHTDTVDWKGECATGDRLAFIPALANDTAAFHIGDATYTGDLALFGATASTVLFDASANVAKFDVYNIALGDGDQLLLGDTLGTGDFSISDESDVLLITQVSDGVGEVEFSADGEGMDVTFYGDTASSKMVWDENGDTNGSLVITGGTQTITGINSGGNLLTLTGIDQAQNADTLIITHKGTGSGILVTAGEADSVAGEFVACAAQTTSLVVVDGFTSDWDGADNVGMLHISSDAPVVHTGASLLHVCQTGTPIAAAEGFLARFRQEGGSAVTDAYAVEIEVVATTGGLHCNGYATFDTGLQVISQAVTATSNGLTTGLIPDHASFVTVTSSSADYVVVLPTWVIGHVIRITVPSTGCELETLDTSNDTINAVDCDGTNQMAMAAASIYHLECVADSTWIAYAWGSDGAAQATIVPDAD